MELCGEDWGVGSGNIQSVFFSALNFILPSLERDKRASGMPEVRVCSGGAQAQVPELPSMADFIPHKGNAPGYVPTATSEVGPKLPPSFQNKP